MRTQPHPVNKDGNTPVHGFGTANIEHFDDFPGLDLSESKSAATAPNKDKGGKPASRFGAAAAVAANATKGGRSQQQRGGNGNGVGK